MKPCDHKKYFKSQYVPSEGGITNGPYRTSAFESNGPGVYKCSQCGSRVIEVVTETVNGIPAEIEFYDENRNQIGFWAYGHYHPNYPFQGF